MLHRSLASVGLSLTLVSQAFAQTTDQKAAALQESGLAYLAAQQQPDGTWQPVEQVPQFCM